MRRRGFTLIELLVTLAIIGIILVSVLPSLSKYGRSNNVNIASQTMRQALQEVKTMATALDPSNCPIRNGRTDNWWSINAYAIYINPSQSTPNNSYPNFLPSPSTEYPTSYTCGQYDSPQVLAQDQYAVLALHVTTHPDTPTDLTTRWISVLGIVKIDTIEDPAIFIQNGSSSQASPTNPIALIYSSPDGGFFTPTTLAGGLGDSGVMYNLIPATGDAVVVGGQSYTVQSVANQKYAIITLGNKDNYTSTIFVNIATGQVTSTNKLPSGIN